MFKVNAKKSLKQQQKVLTKCLKQSQQTMFGRDHHFEKIKDYLSFKTYVPIPLGETKYIEPLLA